MLLAVDLFRDLRVDFHILNVDILHVLKKNIENPIDSLPLLDDY